MKFIPLALTLAASMASAAPIDLWEPLDSPQRTPTSLHTSRHGLFHVIGYDNGDIFQTSTIGTPTWTQINTVFNGSGWTPVRPGLVTSLAVGSDYSQTVAFVSYATPSRDEPSKLYKIVVTHNGPTMTDLSGRIANGQIRAVSLNPLDDAFVYVPTAGGTFYSGNGGVSFQTTPLASDPLAIPAGLKVTAVTQWGTGAGSIYAGTDNGQVWEIDATSPAGSWRRVDSSMYDVGPRVRKAVTRISFGPPQGRATAMVVSFDAEENNAWSGYLTPAGFRAWTNVASKVIVMGGSFATVRNISLNPVYQSAYGYAEASYAMTWPARADYGPKSWFATARSSGRNVGVEYKHYDTPPYSNQLMPVLRVLNLGSVAASFPNGVWFQYFQTKEGTAPEFYDCDWSSYGCNHVQATVSPTGPFTIKVNAAVSAPIEGESGEVQGRLHKADWSVFGQSNDFSFVPEAYNWVVNDKIQLRDGSGALLWGMAPGY